MARSIVVDPVAVAGRRYLPMTHPESFSTDTLRSKFGALKVSFLRRSIVLWGISVAFSNTASVVSCSWEAQPVRDENALPSCTV